jgi:hypothetical protein
MQPQEFLFFAATIAWDMLWVQVVLIPFYSKNELLHKDYIDSGSKGLSISFIEYENLIKPLATLFKKVRIEQPDRRLNLSEEDFADLLNKVEYLPYLNDIESALQEKKKIETSYNFLERISPWLWKFCLIHVIAMISMPTIYYLVSSKSTDSALFKLAIWTSILSFCFMLIGFIAFDSKKNCFLRLLNKYRRSS